MERRAFARRPSGTLELDICWTCHAFWFDQYESTALAPRAVMELFALIDAHRRKPERPATQVGRCPVCRDPLSLTQDVQRTNRITYWRCQRGDGRFTTFYQFLREKNFVRSLTLGEVERLKAHVQQVRCSSCGAGVDLAREMSCAYCKAPLSILDADAVRKTIGELTEAERRRHTVDPMAVVDGLLAGAEVERRLATYQARPSGTALKHQLADITARYREPKPMDLVDEALHALLGER